MWAHAERGARERLGRLENTKHIVYYLEDSPFLRDFGGRMLTRSGPGVQTPRLGGARPDVST